MKSYLKVQLCPNSQDPHCLIKNVLLPSSIPFSSSKSWAPLSPVAGTAEQTSPGIHLATPLPAASSPHHLCSRRIYRLLRPMKKMKSPEITNTHLGGIKKSLPDVYIRFAWRASNQIKNILFSCLVFFVFRCYRVEPRKRCPTFTGTTCIRMAKLVRWLHRHTEKFTFPPERTQP